MPAIDSVAALKFIKEQLGVYWKRMVIACQKTVYDFTAMPIRYDQNFRSFVYPELADVYDSKLYFPTAVKIFDNLLQRGMKKAIPGKKYFGTQDLEKLGLLKHEDQV